MFYSYDFFLTVARWEYRVSILPRRCYISNTIIRPFKMAYRGTATICGPGADVIDRRWITTGEYFKGKITKTLR